MDSPMQASRTNMPQTVNQAASQYKTAHSHGMARADMELLFRNAQLETELRLVKEQLAQAHQSTQYLLQLMSGASSDTKDHRASNRESRLQYALNQTVARKDSILDTIETTSDTTSSSQLVNLGDEEQLLLDDTAEEDHNIDTPSLIPSAHLPHRKHVEDSIGLGVSLGISPHSSFATSTEANASDSDNQPGFCIRQSNGTAVFIPTPTLGRTPESSFSSSKPSSTEPAPFLGHEHRSLAGKAFVWVDMSPEELTEVVARYAKEHPRHTAEQYRAYFEEVVRPAYYRKEEEKRGAREVAVNRGCGRPGEIGAASQIRSVQDCQREQDGECILTALPASGDAAPVRDQEYINTLDLVAEGVAAEVLESLTGNSPQGLEHSMHAVADCIPSTKINGPASAAAANDVPVQIEGEPEASFSANVPVGPPHAAVPSPEQAETDFEEQSSYTAVPTATAAYQPPRLFNPDGLDVAKLLQAEFQNGSTSRGRRGRDYPQPSVEHSDAPFAGEEHHRHGENQLSHRRDSKDPGNFDRPRRAPVSSYITYPYQISELFTTSTAGEAQPYRTVLISDLPPNTKLALLLDHIRGGNIFSAILLDTAGMRTNPPLTTNSALITFINGRDARRIAKRCSVSARNYNSFTAHLLQTVSRPIPARVQADIQHLNLSRILFIHDTATEQTSTPEEVVLELVRRGVRIPLRAEADAEVPGLMLFHFASLAEAKMAWNVVQRDQAFFGNVASGFFADPCGKLVGSDGDGSEGVDETGEPIEGGDDGEEAGEDVVQASEKVREPSAANGQSIHWEATDNAIMSEG